MSTYPNLKYPSGNEILKHCATAPPLKHFIFNSSQFSLRLLAECAWAISTAIVSNGVVPLGEIYFVTRHGW